jgi:RND superfamily putative drug exporter
MTSLNFAARAGRWSADHWKTAVFGWLAFVLVAVALGQMVGQRKLTDVETASGETARAERIFDHAGFANVASESVLVQSSTRPATDPRFEATVVDVMMRLRSLPDVKNVSLGGRISRDGHSALIEFDVRGDGETASDRIQPMLGAVRAAQQAHPHFFIGEFGGASSDHELSGTQKQDFRRAEYSSLPITLLIMLLAFGAFVAAGLPVLLAISAVLSTLGLSNALSHLIPLDDATQSVVLLMGMAVGVDYSLFYLRREREERAAGASHREALLRTAATSGRAVLVSGLTVLIAMAGMLFTGNKTFTSVAVSTMVVVAVSVAGSVTVLPALLARLGDRVNRGRIPFLHRRVGARHTSRFWQRVIRPTLRRPALAAALASGALVTLAVPALSLHTQLPSMHDLPRSIGLVETYDRIQAAFPGTPAPAVVAVRAHDVNAPQVRRAIAALRSRALASGQMSKPIAVHVNPSHTVAAIEVPLRGTGDDATSQAALRTLRQTIVPATVGKVGGVEAAVTGETAGSSDFNQQMKSRAPLVFGFVSLLAFLLLLVTFRSIVIPLKAIVLNLLSTGAAYGLLVAVFQWGWGESLLGFQSNGAIASWLPLFLFVVLFALSMDYHVFILSRVKELVDAGMRTEDAVGQAITRTAGTVTSAAVVMVAVFAIFATLHQPDIKQMGFGLAVAILIDATVIRAVLLPASMKLLGDWNWYLPRRLDWLPRLRPSLESTT